MIQSGELCIPATDIGRFTIKCACGAETTVNMAIEEHRKLKWDRKENLPACGVCGRAFSSTLRSGLSYFAKWFGEAQNVKDEIIYFRLASGAGQIVVQSNNAVGTE